TAKAVKVATAPAGPVASDTMPAGTLTLGGVVSCTVTLNEALPVLPAASLAVQVTLVVPNENVEPDAGLHAGITFASSGSLAVATKVATAPLGPVASNVVFDGTVTTGAVVSAATVLFNSTPYVRS